MSVFRDTVENNGIPKCVKQLSGKTGAELCVYDSGLKVVVKKIAKQDTVSKQRGLRVCKSGRRAVAFYKLAVLLGYEYMVPQIVLKKTDDTYYVIQQYVDAVSCGDVNPVLREGADVPKKEWVRTLKKVCTVVPRTEWVKLIVLDILSCSRDRHINNIGFTTTGEVTNTGKAVIGLAAWDNACTFGLCFTKYKQVFHKYLFNEQITEIAPCLDMLGQLTDDVFYAALRDVLTEEEITDTYLRCRYMLRYTHRLPYALFSEGARHSRDFPSRRSYFILGRHTTFTESE